MSTDTGPRVLVAHGVAATRVGVRLALEAGGFAVCAESSHRADALSAALRTRPDVCLVDAGLPGGATPTVRDITSRLPGIPVVVLGDVADTAGFLEAVGAGAGGYLSEAVSPEMLARTLHRVAEGEAGISRALATSLIDELRERGLVRSVLVPGRGRVELSHRQSQVIGLAREGRSTFEIGARLGIDPVTVRRHLLAAQHKLGAPSRSAAVALAANREPWLEPSTV